MRISIVRLRAEMSKAHGLDSLLFVTAAFSARRKERLLMKSRSVPVLVVLSLCLLVGCSASPATTTSRPTSTTAPATLPAATSVPSPIPTADRDPFQVNFLQHYQIIDCPAEQNPTKLCYTLQDDPSTSPLGTVSFAGTDILYVLPQGASCGPAERHGAFKLVGGDTISIQATGMYCVPGYPVQFIFTVTGGTGKYFHASGGGTIDVGPARNSPPTATEFWSGTIHQP